jgi:hypothetical protein
MSDERRFEIAKQYVDKQLETMRRYGSAPKQMSDQEYRAMVQQIAETVKTEPIEA